MLEHRVRLREAGPPEDEIDGARWWAQHFDTVRVEDRLVKTDDRTVNDIAREILEVAQWLL